MSNCELLVGADRFWQRARSDIARAQQRVLIQAMTFEGDAVGHAVAEAIGKSAATDRRVLVDDYSRHVINDTFLAVTRDQAVLAEGKATLAMFDALCEAGVQLRLTNPIGRNPLRYARRNHKKLLVIDDVAWLGGVNFSEHNFAWHDMMVRIEDDAVADWLSEGFAADWAGAPRSLAARIGTTDLLDFSGEGNDAGFAGLLALFAGARRSIEVVSAYPTFPFVDALAEAARGGVQVTIYTPRPNNKPIIRDYLLGAAARSGIEIRLTPMMTHAKAALIDGEILVAGSSNFDFVSYSASAEYVAILRDTELIFQFVTEVLEPLHQGSGLPSAGDNSLWRAWRARAGLGIAAAVVSVIRPGPRIALWTRP